VDVKRALILRKNSQIGASASKAAWAVVLAKREECLERILCTFMSFITLKNPLKAILLHEYLYEQHKDELPIQTISSIISIALKQTCQLTAIIISRSPGQSRHYQEEGDLSRTKFYLP